MNRAIQDMGMKIREIRQAKGLKLKDVAHVTGLTESLLSQIENSKANPSITSLVAISKALDTPISTFFDVGEDQHRSPVLRRSERTVSRTSNGILYYLLTPHLEEMPFEVLFCEYQPGADTGEFITHDGVECGIILEGKLEVRVEEDVHILNGGDNIIIASNRPHRMKNISDKLTTTIWIDSPPTF